MHNVADQCRYMGLPLPPRGHSDHLNPIVVLKKIDNDQQEKQKKTE